MQCLQVTQQCIILMQLEIIIIDILFQQDQQMSQSQLESCGEGSRVCMRVVPLGFEKNYPKNIFIPILQYLNELGLRENYEQCVGTRELFEGKNVVSLAILHQLITQPWFIEAVDRTALITSVCNKILINSKIKKKLFHLKVAEVVLAENIPCQRDFRHHVSRHVAQLSAARVEYDEFFDFPNLTIYLFHLMACVLDENLTPRIGFTFPVKLECKEQEEEEDSQPNKAHVSSKQEFRLYLKLMIKVFNDQRYKVGQFAMLQEKLSDLLASRQREFQEKYCLPDDMLNWHIFMTEVAQKCFAYKRRGSKLTNMALNQWIDNFKTSFLKTNYKRKCKEVKMLAEEHTDHEEKSSVISNQLSHTSRDFQPIILHFPSLNSPTIS